MTRHFDPTERRGALHGLLAVFFFAANVLCLRGISLHAPAADGWVATFMRGVVGLAVLFLAFGGNRGFAFTHLLTRPVLIARGIIGGITITILYLSIEHLGAGRAIIINLTYPLFGAVLAALCLGESLSLRALACLACGFAGLALFLSDSFQSGAVGFYDWLALGGAVLAAVIVLLLRHLRHTEHPSTIYGAQCLYGLVLAFPMSTPGMTHISGPVWIALVLVSVLVACGQLLLTHSFRHLSVTKGSGIQMLLPPLTAAGGMLFFDESFTAVEITGASVTLAATWALLSTPADRSSSPPARQAP